MKARKVASGGRKFNSGFNKAQPRDQIGRWAKAKGVARSKATKRNAKRVAIGLSTAAAIGAGAYAYSGGKSSRSARSRALQGVVSGRTLRSTLKPTNKRQTLLARQSKTLSLDAAQKLNDKGWVRQPLQGPMLAPGDKPVNYKGRTINKSTRKSSGYTNNTGGVTNNGKRLVPTATNINRPPGSTTKKAISRLKFNYVSDGATKAIKYNPSKDEVWLDTMATVKEVKKNNKVRANNMLKYGKDSNGSPDIWTESIPLARVSRSRQGRMEDQTPQIPIIPRSKSQISQFSGADALKAPRAIRLKEGTVPKRPRNPHNSRKYMLNAEVHDALRGAQIGDALYVPDSAAARAEERAMRRLHSNFGSDRRA